MGETTTGLEMCNKMKYLEIHKKSKSKDHISGDKPIFRTIGKGRKLYTSWINICPGTSVSLTYYGRHKEMTIHVMQRTDNKTRSINIHVYKDKLVLEDEVVED